MKKLFSLLLLFVTCAVYSADVVLTSGEVNLEFTKKANVYTTALSYKGQDIPFKVAGQPAYAEVQGKVVSANYSEVSKEGDKVKCVANLKSGRGSELTVTDVYSVVAEGQIEVKRDVKVVSVRQGDNYFLSAYMIQSPENAQFLDNDYLVPGVLYKSNFDAACNNPAGIPQKNDIWFIYRDDRTPLPMVMARGKSTGRTYTLALSDTPSRTVMADNKQTSYDAGYQYGSVGVWRDTANTRSMQCVYWPGTTMSTKQGSGMRYHPMKTDVKHSYGIYMSFSSTDGYPTAVNQDWNRVFDLYQPKIYPVDLDTCYEGLIQSLLTYYVPCRADGGVYDAPGFPFEVSLEDFKPRGIDYQCGFVGMQVSSGYCLYRYGIENADEATRHKGEAVLNFWADKSLGKAGIMKTWYDPNNGGGGGSWRSYHSILRIMTGGMEGLLSAWCYGTKKGEKHDNWMATCKTFGDWMLVAQDPNGSFAFSWNQNKLVNGKYPVDVANGLTTTSALRYLVELYIATGEDKYKEAALRAGEYCYMMVHKKYHYCACVVDNPQVLDSESGYMAMAGFLSLYDLTRDSKWLEAAEQAATYTETWVYCHEIPVEDDREGDIPWFPKDRSIVGQHLIAIGHSAADLGFAWLSFLYYHLYVLTDNDHYLMMSRMAAHNTKQSMNWDGSLFPGQPRGLQLEAFQVKIPRRVEAVKTTLNWNYAGNLDPMLRFKDAFGTANLEEVEKMSKTDRMEKLKRYMLYQSSDYGQYIDPTIDLPIIPYNKKAGDIRYFTMEGQEVSSPFSSGCYLQVINDNNQISTHKLFIQ